MGIREFDEISRRPPMPKQPEVILIPECCANNKGHTLSCYVVTIIIGLTVLVITIAAIFAT